MNEADYRARMNRDMMRGLVDLLKRYEMWQSRADSFLRSNNLNSIDKGLKIIHEHIDPIWNELKNKVIPNSGNKTFWQVAAPFWIPRTLPPTYKEVHDAFAKYNIKKTMIATFR